MEIISETSHGRILKRENCNAVYIEFNNLNFNFKKDEYDFFKNAILGIDGEKWEEVNKNCCYNRKILVPIGHRNFNVLLNYDELQELKQLITGCNQKLYKNFKQYRVCNLNFMTNLN